MPNNNHRGLLEQGAASARGRRTGRGAFTLIEMLAVMGIMVVLIGLLAPSALSLLGGSPLTIAAQTLNDQLNLARETALARNLPVEVRFYRYADGSSPGEAAGQPGTGRFRAVQLFQVGADGAATPLAGVQTLPTGMILDAGPTLSTLLGGSAGAAVPVVTTGSALNVPIPAAGLSYNAVTFRYLPDGATTLPKTLAAAPPKWFVTVHSRNAGDALATPPKNFVSLQIDASNGQNRTYRP